MKRISLLVLTGFLIFLFSVPAHAAPDYLTFDNQTVISGQVVDETARFSITAGPAYEIQDGADVTFNSENIILKPGFCVRTGGLFTAHTDNHTAFNASPIAVADSMTVDEGGTVTVLDSTATSVLANDTDEEGDALTAVLDTGVINGSLTLNPGGTFSYTHNGGETTSDAFTYHAMDSEASNTVTVSISVTPVNDNPVAAHDSYAVAEDSGNHTLAVLVNDTDADPGDSITITFFTPPNQDGTLVNNSTSLTYTPASDFTGLETFSYTITDTQGATASTTVTVTVVNSNDAPQANNDSYTVNEDTAGNVFDVLVNDTDVDVGDTMTISTVSSPNNGGMVENNTTSLSYSPASNFSGTETFTYTIVDGAGVSSTASVTITVNNINAPPTAVPDNASTAVDTPITINVTGNDTDPDGDPLSIFSFSQPENASVVANGTGSLDFTPVPGFFGIAIFSYTISDNNGGTSTSQVTVLVLPVNDIPVDLILQNDIVPAGESQEYYAINSILAGPSYVVENGAALTLGAGSITLRPGFRVASGGTLYIKNWGADNAPPQVTGSTPADGSTVYTNGEPLPFTVNYGDDASGVKIIKIFDEEGNDITSQAVITNDSLQITIPDPEDGKVYKYFIFMIDYTGKVTVTEITFTVIVDTVPPITDAGPDQIQVLGSTVQLDGSGSSDDNGGPLSYSWSFDSRPAGSSAVLIGATTFAPIFIADAIGEFRIHLTVRDLAGNISGGTVVITVPPLPTVNLAVDPTVVLTGQEATLSWSIVDADTASMDNGIGSITLTGSTTVAPVVDTTYTITATGPGGATTAQVSVDVIAPPLPTVNFSVDPTVVVAGQEATLSWSIVDANTASIDNGIGSVPLSGSTTVAPVVDTTYTITVTGLGGTETAQVSVSVMPQEAVYFFHTDQFNTPLAVTDETGEKVWEADYMPFGEEDFVSSLIPNDKRFIGKEKDEETGLSYFGARYMDVDIGRFLAPDPVRAVDISGKINAEILANPQRLQLYGYGLNNPYRYVDPDGNNPILLLLIGKGIALGTSYFGVQASTHATQAISSQKAFDEGAHRAGNKMWSRVLEVNRVPIQTAVELSGPLDMAVDAVSVATGKDLMATNIDSAGNWNTPKMSAMDRGVTGGLVVNAVKYSKLGKVMNSKAVAGVGKAYDAIEAGLSIKSAARNTDLSKKRDR